MGILDELTAKVPAASRLDQWLETRPKAERDEWRKALAETKVYSSGAIARLLTAKGFPADDNMVARYRRMEARRVSK
jgi:hypothetical protein